jgi:hypothetical protein
VAAWGPVRRNCPTEKPLSAATAARRLDRALAEAREIVERRFAPPSLDRTPERDRAEARRTRRA